MRHIYHLIRRYCTALLDVSTSCVEKNNVHLYQFQNFDIDMIGYRKVGDCTYPTLTGHTLRNENIKLIQLLKAIKSETEILKKSNIMSDVEQVDNLSNRKFPHENAINDSNMGSSDSRIHESFESNRGEEGEGLTLLQSDIQKGSKVLEDSNEKIDRNSEQPFEILNNGTHIASEDLHRLLDVD